MSGIPDALVHPALARRHGDALLGPQPVEGDENLARVAAAHAVGDDVHAVPGVAQVERRLRDADVRLDADEGDGRSRGEMGRQLGREHGELGLVEGRGGEQLGDGRDGGAEFGDGLGCGVDGDGKGVCEGDELAGGEDAWGVKSVA